MAANDYYGTPPRDDRPAVDYNAPLPPVPPATPGKPLNATSRTSRTTSPITDDAYATSYDQPFNGHHDAYAPVYEQTPDGHQPDQGSNMEYFGPNGGRDDYGVNNPFADHIPLKTQTSNHSARQQAYNPESDLGLVDHVEAVREQRKGGRTETIDDEKRRIPWFVYTMTVIQIGVFIGEVIRNAMLTGSPIMIHPQFNPMIGPSTYVQINMGARFVPCMRSTKGVQDSTRSFGWPCPNVTSSDPNQLSRCTLSQLCGFHGVPEPRVGGSLKDQPQPNQWYRFILPIFLHAGLIHISFNMLLQLTLGRDMEQSIGPLRLALVYFSSGIFGFVMGGNYAATGIASTGASGCLFGILALNLLELLYTWNERRSPVKDLSYLLLEVVISFVLGLLPGLDNFSHIGGFLMGLVLGVCLLRSPNALRQRVDQGQPPYRPVAPNTRLAVTGFIKRPLDFFKGRKGFWWVWWLFRAGALIGVLIAFVVLLNNFYKYRTECKWCKYLSCLPINNWCDLGTLHISGNTTNSTSKRDLLG